MKGFLRWIGRILATAISVVLIIVLLPHASQWVSRVMPDVSGAAVTASVTLAHQMQSSARLETLVVDDEGVLTSTTDAMFLGQVQSVTIQYSYHASLGIDLSRVNMKVEGDTITFLLPEMEILSDSLTPTEITKDDFWYPLTDARRQKLLEDEQAQCREKCLSSYAVSQDAWQSTISTLEGIFSAWLGEAAPHVTFHFLRASENAKE